MARSSISPPKPESAAHKTILNPKRPSNPYAAADEPDWVNIPRSESRLSSFSSMSTSPYEHVNHSMLLSTSASSSTPRKLPPPYDPSSLPGKFGRPQTGEDQAAAAQLDGPPPPPPPRRQTAMTNGSSSASTAQLPRKPVSKPTPTSALTSAPAPATTASPVGTSSVSATSQQAPKPKGPPPVAKKPAHLAAPASPATSSSASLGSQAESQGALPRIQPPRLPRRSTGLPSTVSNNRGGHSPPPRSGDANGRDEGMPPQLPRRAASSTSIAKPGRSQVGAVGHVGLAKLDQKPQAAAQKPVMVAHKPPPPPPMSRKPQAVDLLGDDAGAEMGGWEALKPSR